MLVEPVLGAARLPWRLWQIPYVAPLLHCFMIPASLEHGVVHRPVASDFIGGILHNTKAVLVVPIWCTPVMLVATTLVGLSELCDEGL